jgi:hypothetical protein
MSSNNRELLLLSLSKYYSNKAYVAHIVPIITGASNISLRLIDWFVTNYAKKHATIITQETGNNVFHFNVYLSYRSQLKAYSKQLFDPFRRRDRIIFCFDPATRIETTIGQLNFFRWLLQNNLLKYIEQNLKEIEGDMLLTQKENTSKKTQEETIDKTKVVKAGVLSTGEQVQQKRKKRMELSKSFLQNMNTVVGNHKITFD